MSNEIATRNEQNQISPWRAYADENLAPAIAGDLLTFAKGKWRRGEAKALVPPEARFLCNMQEVWTGWVRWFNGQAVEHRIARLIDFPKPVPRQDLGHTDKSAWEIDPQGNPRDPWSRTDRMIMREVGPTSSELLTFSTSSIGSRHALSRLCLAFDRSRLKHKGRWAIVKLEAETYEHHVYGEIAKPRFRIVDWAYGDVEASQALVAPPVVTTPNDPQVAKELDDKIPF